MSKIWNRTNSLKKCSTDLVGSLKCLTHRRHLNTCRMIEELLGETVLTQIQTSLGIKHQDVWHGMIFGLYLEILSCSTSLWARPLLNLATLKLKLEPDSGSTWKQWGEALATCPTVMITIKQTSLQMPLFSRHQVKRWKCKKWWHILCFQNIPSLVETEHREVKRFNGLKFPSTECTVIRLDRLPQCLFWLPSPFVSCPLGFQVGSSLFLCRHLYLTSPFHA